jgi:hypothetical protein
MPCNFPGQGIYCLHVYDPEDRGSKFFQTADTNGIKCQKTVIFTVITKSTSNLTVVFLPPIPSSSLRSRSEAKPKPGGPEVTPGHVTMVPPPVSPLTTVAYVIGTEENFAGTGGSISNSSGSKGVLYRPNLQKKKRKKISVSITISPYLHNSLVTSNLFFNCAITE